MRLFCLVGASGVSLGYHACSHVIATDILGAAGIAIGDGLVDPINQLDYGTMLYNVGLIDSQQQVYFTEKAQETADLINQEKFLEAFHVSLALVWLV